MKELMTDGLQPAHYDMRFVKPLDTGMLHDIFQRYDRVITVEDGALRGRLRRRSAGIHGG